MVPFIKTKNGHKYLCSNIYKTFKYFQFPQTSLTYADIPTRKNKDDEDIINVSLFYRDFKECIYQIADNAIKRIM